MAVGDLGRGLAVGGHFADERQRYVARRADNVVAADHGPVANCAFGSLPLDHPDAELVHGAEPVFLSLRRHHGQRRQHGECRHAGEKKRPIGDDAKQAVNLLIKASLSGGAGRVSGERPEPADRGSIAAAR